MGAQFVELRMQDCGHRLKNPALRYLGTHMTHMFHPRFMEVVEAFLRGELEVDQDDPCMWRVKQSGSLQEAERSCNPEDE
jgi:hypothetical protein